MSGLQALCFSCNPPSPPLPRTTLSPNPKPPITTPQSQRQTTSLDHINSQPILADLPANVKEKILCLEIMGIDSGKALSANPSLHDATLDSIHAVVSYLQSKGIHQKDMGRILGMCPAILTADVRTDLAPVFRFLSEEMGVPDSPKYHRRCINKCPRLLVSSVRDQLKPALIYLERLGFEDRDALAFNDPVLLVSSVDHTLMPKLEYLQVGMGFTREEAVGMVLRCPGLFTFSIENNFKPKYSFFLEHMEYRSKEELRDFPQYFAFSLEKRIKPRHDRVVQCGKLHLPLPLVLKSTDDEFERLLMDDSQTV